MRVLIWGLLMTATAVSAERKNVLFVVVDDLRKAPWIQMPNVDAIAEDGVRFTRAYAPCPMCNPSRIAMLCGLYPHTSGQYENLVMAQETLPTWEWLPTLIRKAGWATGIHGKVFHGGSMSAVPGSCYASHEDVSIYHQTTAAEIGDVVLDAVLDAPHQSLPISVHHTDDDSRFTDGITTERALQWLDGQDLNEPWALWVGYYLPHLPLRIQARDLAYYERRSIPMNHEPPITDQGYAWRLRDPGNDPGAVDWGDDDRAFACRAYAAGVRLVDRQIGRIRAELMLRGEWDDTMVIIVSDHGFALGEHGLYGKNAAIRETLEVPLVIRDPEGQAGVVTDRTVSLVDLYATVTDLLGVARVEPTDGRSFAGEIQAEGWTAPDPLGDGYALAAVRDYSAWRSVSVLSHGKRFTRPKSLGVQFYDHVSDPWETDPTMVGGSWALWLEAWIRPEYYPWSVPHRGRDGAPEAADEAAIRAR